MRASSVVGRRLVRRGAEQHAGALAAERHAGREGEQRPSARVQLARARAQRLRRRGSQASASSDQGSSAFRIFTAACLSSGCFDCGQYADVVSALTPASALAGARRGQSRNSVAPVHGDEGLRRRDLRRSRCTGTTIEPRREVTCTRSPSARPRRAMSCAFISTAGSATWPNSRPSVPVRLMPCHWSRSRPVFSAERDSAHRAARPAAVGARRRSGPGRRRWGRRRPRRAARCPRARPRDTAIAAGAASSRA